MTLFEPKGEKAQWRLCVDLVLEHEINDTIYYDEVEELLDCDRRTAQRAMRLARTYLLEQGSDRFPATAQQTGWVIRDDPAKLGYADGVEDKAVTAVKHAFATRRATNREKLSQTDRERLDRDIARSGALVGLMTGERFRPGKTVEPTTVGQLPSFRRTG